MKMKVLTRSESKARGRHVVQYGLMVLAENAAQSSELDQSNCTLSFTGGDPLGAKLDDVIEVQ